MQILLALETFLESPERWLTLACTANPSGVLPSVLPVWSTQKACRLCSSDFKHGQLNEVR